MGTVFPHKSHRVVIMKCLLMIFALVSLSCGDMQDPAPQPNPALRFSYSVVTNHPVPNAAFPWTAPYMADQPQDLEEHAQVAPVNAIAPWNLGYGGYNNLGYGAYGLHGYGGLGYQGYGQGYAGLGYHGYGGLGYHGYGGYGHGYGGYGAVGYNGVRGSGCPYGGLAYTGPSGQSF